MSTQWTGDALPDANAARLGRYEVRAELGRGATGIVFEALDRESGAVVALKTLRSLDAETLFRLKHEFRSLANVEHENFVRFGELTNDGGQLFFTMERVYGSDFLQYVRPSGRLDEARLRRALEQIVEGLGALHAARRIHCDIKPSNVLVTTNGRVVLLDFGLTARFGVSDDLAGTPEYMAPEQIGAGEKLTSATDWYAVGVMLYAALNGRLPFEGDVTEILDAKVSGHAPRPCQSDCPEDLRSLCMALLHVDGAARPTPDDIRARLGMSRALRGPREVFIGREKELARLREALGRARSGTQAIVVTGEAGMGKSSLIERFLFEVQAQALVMRGRCYEQETVPFGGVDSFVDALSEYLVGLSDSAVERLLAGGVSNVARVFPVLYRVRNIGAQRVDGPVLNPTVVREQAFRELTWILSELGRTRPLVVFIDDLQWIDGDSLTVLHHVLSSSTVRCLFVATMRSESTLPAAVRQFVATLETMSVSRLSGDESIELCNALVPLQADVRQAVLREAAGHPLFLAELLHSAHGGKLEQHVSTRLQDVLWDRISERDAIERRFLEMAALAGAPTPYAVLAQAAGLDVGECSTRLAGLRAGQLVRITRLDDERCVEPYHDRVREAVMERLRGEGEPRVAERHLSLGRALLAATSESKLPSRIFPIVQHLNLGRTQLGSDEERRDLARLNLLASRQAYLATVFGRACEYARIGLENLGQDGWSNAYALCRDLHQVRMEAEYVDGHGEAARATFEAAKGRLRDPEEKATLYATWIEFVATGGHSSSQKALEAGREVLEAIGTPVPARASKVDILREYVMVRWVQRGRSAADLESLPVTRDPTLPATIRVMSAMGPAAYFVEPDLVPWMLLHMARRSMESGVTSWSTTAIAGYGMVLTGAFGRREEGAAFGRLAVTFAERLASPRMRMEAYFFEAYFLQPWVRPFRESIEKLQQCYELADKLGIAAYQIYGSIYQASVWFWEGANLRKTRECAERVFEIGLQRNGKALALQADTVARYAAALQGDTPGLKDLSVPRSTQKEFLASVEEAHATPTLLVCHLLRADLAYLAGDVSEVEAYLAEADKLRDVGFSTSWLAELQLLHALIDSRRCDYASLRERSRRVARMVRSARTLAAWARSCPSNFEPLALLAHAELSRVCGRSRGAAKLYDRASASAQRHGSPKREAMAYERAMDLANLHGRKAEAQRYRSLAVDAYRRWGATAKARDLERRTCSSPAGPPTD